MKKAIVILSLTLPSLLVSARMTASLVYNQNIAKQNYQTASAPQNNYYDCDMPNCNNREYHTHTNYYNCGNPNCYNREYHTHENCYKNTSNHHNNYNHHRQHHN